MDAGECVSVRGKEAGEGGRGEGGVLGSREVCSGESAMGYAHSSNKAALRAAAEMHINARERAPMIALSAWGTAASKQGSGHW